VKDLLFISFVRETGAIPAVLMLTIVALGLRDVNGLVEIGMWTILLTLIVEPLLTPWVAKFLGVAEVMIDKKNVKLNDKPAVVLVTRGESFIDRLPFVKDWSVRHNAQKIVVMLCLEDKFTTELEQQIKQKAINEFNKIEQSMKKDGQSAIQFKFVSRRGILDANIKAMAESDSAISVVFVGNKMLDHRLDEIKRLKIPFYFID
jgi:NhaP-type Na+/H+ or K+/H+ antiporter